MHENEPVCEFHVDGFAQDPFWHGGTGKLGNGPFLLTQGPKLLTFSLATGRMRLRAHTHSTLIRTSCLRSMRISCSCSLASVLAAFPRACMHITFSSAGVFFLVRRSTSFCRYKVVMGMYYHVWRELVSKGQITPLVSIVLLLGV